MNFFGYWTLNNIICITIYMLGHARVQEIPCLHPSILEIEKNEKVFTEKISVEYIHFVIGDVFLLIFNDQ